MVRTQIQLTEEQARNLKEMAIREKTSIADLVRKSVDALINSSAGIDSDERISRAILACGKYHSGSNDISTNHDAHLAEAYDS